MNKLTLVLTCGDVITAAWGGTELGEVMGLICDQGLIEVEEYGNPKKSYYVYQDSIEYVALELLP